MQRCQTRQLTLHAHDHRTAVARASHTASCQLGPLPSWSHPTPAPRRHLTAATAPSASPPASLPSPEGEVRLIQSAFGLFAIRHSPFAIRHSPFARGVAFVRWAPRPPLESGARRTRRWRESENGPAILLVLLSSFAPVLPSSLPPVLPSSRPPFLPFSLSPFLPFYFFTALARTPHAPTHPSPSLPARTSPRSRWSRSCSPSPSSSPPLASPLPHPCLTSASPLRRRGEYDDDHNDKKTSAPLACPLHTRVIVDSVASLC